MSINVVQFAAVAGHVSCLYEVTRQEPQWALQALKTLDFPDHQSDIFQLCSQAFVSISFYV